MLVVIGMIAALAGISFPVYRSIQKKVEKQQLAMDMNSLKRGVDNFLTEYNYLPYVGAVYPNSDQSLNAAGIRSFMNVLVGQDVSINFKGINFFEAQEVKGEVGNYHSGLLTNADGTVIYYTPWGVEIRGMRLDSNLDGVIDFVYDMGPTETNLKFIYWDRGPDDKWYDLGSNPGTVKDDLENFRYKAYE